MSAPDRIHLDDLAVQCIIGTLPEERTTPQEVVLQVALEVNLHRAGLSDSLDDTIDYQSLEERIVQAAEAARCQLIERLAQVVAEVCLQEQRVEAVTVRVEKPGAPVRSRVAVEIRRERG